MATADSPVTAFSEVITGPNLAQFLAVKNWTCQADRTVDQVWTPPSAEGERIRPVLVPREPSFVDYEKRLLEASEAIASRYGWHISELAQEVAAIRADLFFLRVNQDSMDGTIPLGQAASLLENIDVMVRSAAVTTHNPQSSGRGQLPAIVRQFMADDLRMGHTKRGSFIITVAARLDIDDTSQPRESTTPDAAERVSDDEEAVEPPRIASFTRQVMTTLARSLVAVREQATGGELSESLDAAAERGMRLPIVRALEGIVAGDGLQSVDMTFEWAASEPQLEELPTSVVVDRPVIDALPDLEQRLTRAHVPIRETIVGPVAELKRSDDQPEVGESGEIVVSAEVEGRVRRVTIPLAGNDYDWAIRAHRARLPFTATGELGKRGNIWRLMEPIEVDRSFLEYRLRADD